ncbi:MAG: hypothetical protein ACRC6V_01820 [Bacteroidales bacterium]
MAQQLSPWLEGAYGWSFGEGGWNSGMDQNLLKFSFMFDRNVDSITAALPAAVNGQAHYNTTDNRLYFAVGTTYFSTVVPKWFTMVIRSTGATWQFNGSTLVEIDSVVGLDVRLDAVELVISSLGSSAFQDSSAFATPAELDIAEANAQQYTDILRHNLVDATDVTHGSAIIGRAAQVVGSIAELRLLDKTLASKHAFCTGYYEQGDGGGGVYYYDNADITSADNGGTVIVADDGGRWKLKNNGSVSVTQFGAVYDGVTDDSAKFLAAATAMSLVGGNVLLPPGQMALTSLVSIPRLESSDFSRVSIIGAGSGQTEIKTTIPSDAAIELLGGAGIAAHSYVSLKGFRMTNQGLGTGTGVRINKAAYLLIDDVIFGGYARGLQGFDMLSCQFNRMMLRSNTIGAQFSYQSVSRPNAINFQSCVITGNTQWGMQFFGGANINMLGGSVEGNGTGVLPGADGGGISFIDSCVEGGVIGSIFGVYFEGNSGIADIYSTASSPILGVGALAVNGNTFQRLSDTYYVPNNILVNHSGAVCVSAHGNGFKAGPSYTPNSSHKYIGFTGSTPSLVSFSHDNLYESSLEAPSFSGREISKETTTAALLVFDGTSSGVGGVLNAKNILSKTKTATGVYDIVLVSSLTNSEPAIQVNAESATIFGFVRTLMLSSNSFRISTYNSSAAPADFNRVRVTIDGA